MYSRETKRLTKLAFVAIIASALAISLTPSYAQKHGGSSHSDASSSHSDHDSGCSGGCSGDEGGGKGKGGPRGSSDMGHGGRSQSLRDIFHGLDASSGTDHADGDEHSNSSKKGGVAGRGKHGNTSTGH